MVFQGVVKIRKGQAVTLMMDATNMRAVQTIIAQYSQEVGVFSSLLSYRRHIGACLKCKKYLPPRRFYRRSPSLTRHGTRPCESWL